MTVTCQICNREFTKMITNSHTKSHGMTTAQYKEKYGPDSMSCPEYREFRRLESLGENNRNYGKTHTTEARAKIAAANSGPKPERRGGVRSEEHSRKISIAAKARWEDPEFRSANTGKTVSAETRKKLSDAMCGRSIDKEVTKRAIATRKARYAPGSRKGKYKPTEEVLKKLNSGLDKARSARKAESLAKRHELAARLDAELLSSVDAKFVKFKCSTCGNIFSRTPQFLTEDKFREDACRVCNPKKFGAAQARLHTLVQDAVGRELESNNRSILGGKELDIYDPVSKVAVEYCGLYWHSSATNDDPRRHLDKQLECEEKGIKLITVFEDEFVDRLDVVVSRISTAMGVKTKRIFARKCEIRELAPKEANAFLKRYHLQGSGRSNYRVGLFSNNELISVMTFSKSNISRGLTDWEINRYATKYGVTVVGGASKLFSAFTKAENPEKVISYSDNRWGTGAVYSALGFTKASKGTPNYWYIDGASRIHRYSLRKNSSDNQELTEWENRFNDGWLRVWDCGHTKWLWQPSVDLTILSS